MNRVITFRGKRVDNGEWVYGYIWICPAKCWIVNVNEEGEAELNLVDPETVGQYTGLNDMNGVEIYEGDILRNDSEDLFFINWFQPNCEFLSTYLYALRDGDAYETETFDGSWVSSEVIGNIYGHPHLIGGESDGN